MSIPGLAKHRLAQNKETPEPTCSISLFQVERSPEEKNRLTRFIDDNSVSNRSDASPGSPQNTRRHKAVVR